MSEDAARLRGLRNLEERGGGPRRRARLDERRRRRSAFAHYAVQRVPAESEAVRIQRMISRLALLTIVEPRRLHARRVAHGVRRLVDERVLWARNYVRDLYLRAFVQYPAAHSERRRERT